ncbi:Gfo/Idh/MocA family oxidoreductase [Halocynthiibacter sp. C4]|uniref:Gfo/Idh/MocA family protein n=1 Tax=Halocynthiibacter sp. C4 TaxID=2992758 RepID=UPI00237A9DF3|nr:Gfo/Idh/MocA family oxidoreductase [Halocynthiibacter sp. C4]MDE0589179.1 Gfo/Idh/MocA family oxidoreductase [Halocynthiibacter sp. C4]
MTKKIGIGVIGCGNISDAYLKAAPQFGVLNMVACADINLSVAEEKAATYGIEALSVEALLADDRIDIVLNLTTPQFHVEVGKKALNAGKHVYSEKPLAVTMKEAMELVDLARETGLRVGCAPDTFFGGSHQTARKLLDAGEIGAINAGSAYMMVPGHESWHPNPDFYYKAGGGPLLDMGPYYITALINMIGPVSSVLGAATRSYETREIGSGAREGESFDVEIDTHISGIMNFANGAQVTITTSFDVHKHEHNHIELYGTKGSMVVPDPNCFDGDVKISEGSGDWVTAEQTHKYGDGNYRILGLADMAQAIVDDRPHRASLELSLHVLEVMEGILTAADRKAIVEMKHLCERPEALPDSLPFGQLG